MSKALREVNMHLFNLLDPKLVWFEDQGLPRDEILKGLIARICSHHQLRESPDQIFRLVEQREKESPTLYPTGMAIPHVRLEGLDDTIIAVCVPRTPLRDREQEVKIYILILTDKNVSSLYLNTVAAFLRISRDPGLYSALLGARDPHAFVKLVREAVISIKEEVTVSDIMTADPIVINENKTIKDLAELMREKHLYYVPVINDQGAWVGDVNILHYLAAGLPDYMKMMNNVNFLRAYEPFDLLYRKEETVTVQQVMQKPERLVRPDFSIIEALFEMERQKKQTFSVIRDGKVVGIITAMDIYAKVVRA